MVDAGSALAVMGNHELNAIAWHTPDPDEPGEYLRPRIPQPKWGAKNRTQHEAFLAEVEADPAAQGYHRLVPDPAALAGPARLARRPRLLARALHGLAVAPSARGGATSRRT